MYARPVARKKPAPTPVPLAFQEEPVTGNEEEKYEDTYKYEEGYEDTFGVEALLVDDTQGDPDEDVVGEVAKAMEEKIEQEDPGDGVGVLPPNWGYRYTPTGRIYFLNHLSKTSTWTDPRSKPRTKPVTVCASFLKGGCVMGSTCLFSHEKTTNVEKIDDFEVTMTMAPPPFEDRDVDDLILNDDVEIDPTEWRFSMNPNDFQRGDRVRIISHLESTEEYRPNQLQRLGEEGVVHEVRTGGHFVSLKHSDGSLFQWSTEDLLVLRPDEGLKKPEHRAKKLHKWVRVDNERRLQAKHREQQMKKTRGWERRAGKGGKKGGKKGDRGHPERYDDYIPTAASYNSNDYDNNGAHSGSSKYRPYNSNSYEHESEAYIPY
eukprot:TRINITY_DN8578_c0_g1_i2.p1 TRINITY_DN8578_c0_g1~~TRINITY_DN8578_c0_g1_i2.p1  ORF type:complete len:375 (+),score=39.17 TRINITY_DN8578_c0_g1_i2:34-1158(+)